MPKQSPKIPLPKGWPASVKSGVLHVIALAQFAMTYARGWAADSVNTRVRLKAELDQANQDNALLREEMRIKDARMAQLDPHHRPHYPPTERLAILELKAARGWSLEQTAKAFLVTAATVASWLRRVDEQGPNALLQLRTPVNRFPDFVRYVVQRLKALCPGMGKVKIAETLARAGLHMGATTVRRILKEKPLPTPSENDDAVIGNQRVVTAKYCGHVWHVDLTTLPTSGFCTTWFPFSLPQCWPFAWWIALAEDHFSRRVMGYAVFRKEPTSIQVRAMLGRAIAAAGKSPRYLVCDKGPQFWCDGFKDWCHRKGIKPPRYGAVGQHGSIAVIERLILTVKGLLRCLPAGSNLTTAPFSSCNTSLTGRRRTRPASAAIACRKAGLATWAVATAGAKPGRSQTATSLPRPLRRTDPIGARSALQGDRETVPERPILRSHKYPDA